jgi:hypothetical protein
VKLPGPDQIGAGVVRISAESFLPQSLQQVQEKSLTVRSLEQTLIGHWRMCVCFVASTGKFVEFPYEMERSKTCHIFPENRKSDAANLAAFEGKDRAGF